MTSSKKTCVICRKKLAAGCKGVLLATFEKENSLEKKYFHFKCYLDWFNRCVEHRANEIIDRSAGRAYNIALKKMPSFIKNMLNNGDKKQDNSSS